VNVLSTPRSRVLVADGDVARRRSVRDALAEDFDVAEVSGAEQTLAWLEGREPGVTLLDHGLPGAAGAEMVARLRELFPHEMVLILAPDPSLGVVRAAMRAGAYDCLDRASLLPAQLRAVCETAASRLEDASARRRAAEDRARAAVRRHEREAAGRLADASSLELWSSVEVTDRRRLVEAYGRAVEAPSGSAERAKAVSELVEALERRERPAALLGAVHLHATAASRPTGSDDAFDRARDVLVTAITRLSDATPRRRDTAPTVLSPPAATPPERGLAWHRWRLGPGEEEWALLSDGVPLARVLSSGGGVRGWMRADRDGARLEAADLPAVPEALREVERRLGLPFVFDVRTASTP
jgi:FixJ family two-component response regulator